MTETAPAGAPETPNAAPQESAQSAPALPPTEAKADAPKAPEAPPKAPFVNPYAKREASKPAPAAPAAPDPAMVERIAALEAQTKAQSEALAGFASQALADMPESVRKVVTELAGEDPARQLTTLSALRRNGLAAGAIPQGTTTAPTAPAPQPGSTRDEDGEALKTLRQLEQSSPLIAAAYKATNASKIERALARNKPSN